MSDMATSAAAPTTSTTTGTAAAVASGVAPAAAAAPDTALPVSDSSKAVTAPAAASTTPATTAAQATGTTTADVEWTNTLSPEMKNFVTNKGFKDPASVLESYVNLEKLRGVPQDRLLKLPETADAPEWNDVYSKLGRPDSPDGYGLQVQEGGDPAFVDWAKQAFHDTNLTKDQAEGIMAKFGDFVSGQDASNSESYKSDVANAEINLKKDWGSAYHQNIAAAQRAAKEFGIQSEAIDALELAIGFDGVMKLMHSIGTKVGEAGYVTGNPATGFGENAILTPEQAVAQIGTLKKDAAFTAKYLAGDTDAKNKLSRLHQMAYPTD